jgi:hypothetical protein
MTGVTGYNSQGVRLPEIIRQEEGTVTRQPEVTRARESLSGHPITKCVNSNTTETTQKVTNNSQPVINKNGAILAPLVPRSLPHIPEAGDPLISLLNLTGKTPHNRPPPISTKRSNSNADLIPSSTSTGQKTPLSSISEKSRSPSTASVESSSLTSSLTDLPEF